MIMRPERHTAILGQIIDIRSDFPEAGLFIFQQHFEIYEVTSLKIKDRNIN